MTVRVGTVAVHVRRQRLEDQLPLPVGSIVITSGGSLSVEHVIHAVTVDTQHQQLRHVLEKVRWNGPM